MVGPNGLEPSTSSVSRKRSNQTELRAYSDLVILSGNEEEQKQPTSVVQESTPKINFPVRLSSFSHDFGMVAPAETKDAY